MKKHPSAVANPANHAGAVIGKSGTKGLTTEKVEVARALCNNFEG